MTRGVHVTFGALDYGRMAIAADEIGALADRVALRLPKLVEKIRLIDQPPRRDRVAA